ncbi:hypothetical protein GOODEAATRI_032351, partial [Goodea atripinnis]
ATQVSRGNSTARWYPDVFAWKHPESHCLPLKPCCVSSENSSGWVWWWGWGNQARRMQRILNPGCSLLLNLIHGDPMCPSLNFWFAILSRPDDDGASGCQRRIFIEEIEWSEEEAHRVARCCCVGDVF